MDEVRIGVAGIGGMGSNHTGYLTKGDGVPGARLTAVADVTPARIEWAKASLGDGVARFDTPESLRSAVATGQVRVVHGERVATGDQAELDVPSGRLEILGAPTLREGARSLRGDRLVLFLDDERLECEACTLEIAADDVEAAVPSSAP